MPKKHHRWSTPSSFSKSDATTSNFKSTPWGAFELGGIHKIVLDTSLLTSVSSNRTRCTHVGNGGDFFLSEPGTQ
jgi:hypothetical protein